MAITTNVPSSNFDDLQRDVQDATRFTNGSSEFKNRSGKTIRPIPLIESDALNTINAQFASVNNITLASGQTDVFLSAGDNYTRPANGSAFYADGERLVLGVDFTIDSDNQISLVNTFPVGTVLTQVANDTVENATAPIVNLDAPVNRYNTSIEVVAHRGSLDSFPQNTMLAFTSAVRRGADALELDVKISADGTAYVFHDTTVDALTNGTGTFTSLSDAYIDSLTFTETQGSRLSDVGIPRFDQFLEYAANTGLRIYPEIKGYRTQSDIEIIIDLINLYGMNNKCVLASFSLSDLQYARAYYADIDLAFLGSGTSQAFYEAGVNAMVNIGRGWILWNGADMLNEPNIYNYAVANGVSVGAYTIDNSRTAQRLMKLGVRHIISDVQLEVI